MRGQSAGKQQGQKKELKGRYQYSALLEGEEGNGIEEIPGGLLKGLVK